MAERERAVRQKAGGIAPCRPAVRLAPASQSDRVRFIETTADQATKVFPEQPFQRVQAVIEDGLELLSAEAGLPRAGRRKSEEAAGFEIIVPAVDVRLTVVEPLMLVHPEMPRRAEQHRAEPCSPEVCGRPTKQRAMVGIVEHAKADGGGSESERNRRQQSQVKRRGGK